MENSKQLHLHESLNATFLAQLQGENTNRFSLGHVPIQLSMKEREVDLFIEPVAWKVMYINVSSLKKENCTVYTQLTVAILESTTRGQTAST